MTSGIYKITCYRNGKFYIGSSYTIEGRWIRHLRALQLKKHQNTYMQNSFIKYGEASFGIEVVEECPREHLLAREQYWIDHLKPTFNIMSIVGGGSSGRKVSAETRRKISASNRGKKYFGAEYERRYRSAKDNRRSCVLTVEQELEIFTKYGNRPRRSRPFQKEIAMMYGVSEPTIFRILHGTQHQRTSRDE